MKPVDPLDVFQGIIAIGVIGMLVVVTPALYARAQSTTSVTNVTVAGLSTVTLADEDAATGVNTGVTTDYAATVSSGACSCSRVPCILRNSAKEGGEKDMQGIVGVDL